jgi:alanine dehydrogenase
LTIFLSESDVQRLISMKEVVAAVEECFREQGAGRASNTPRIKNRSPRSRLSTMPATLDYVGRSGVKSYVSTPAGTRFLFILFDTQTGDPLSVMSADLMGRYRTGAASAVATRALSGLKSIKLAVAGAGRQALTQVTALAEVAELESVSVWSRTRERSEALVRRASADLGIVCKVADQVDSAFAGADVGTTITASQTPFLGERAVKNLSHLNVCGSNEPNRSEVSPEAIRRFRTIIVDDLADSKEESGDLIIPANQGMIRWSEVRELRDVFAGNVKPVPPTLFKSNGVAIEDVAVASLLLDKALASGNSYSNFDFGRVDA